jgi:hypothetical protein
MRWISSALALVMLFGGAAVALAAEPAPSVRYAKGPIAATPGGEPLVLVESTVMGAIRASDHVLPVAPDDALGRHGQKDGDFTAVLLQHGPDLVGWVHTEDLIVVTTTAASLAPSAKAIGKPREVGVTLDPGAAVEVLERTTTAAHVRYQDRWLRTDGWVPLAAVGRVFPEHAATRFIDDPENQSRLPEKVELVATPGGKPLVTVQRPEWPFLGEQVGKVVKKHALVELRWSRVKVVGWLAQDRLAKPSDGVSEGGLEGGVLGVVKGGSAGSNWDKETVAPGTQVLDKPGGTVLGQYDAKDTVKVLETKNGFRRIEMRTDFGSKMTVWLAPAATPR